MPAPCQRYAPASSGGDGEGNAIRVVGRRTFIPQEGVWVETGRFPIARGDLLVLASDGLAGLLELLKVELRRHRPSVLVIDGFAALKEAGAVILGKTNMHELAFGVTGYNPAFQTGPEVGVRNAYDLVWTRDGKLYAPTNGSAAGAARTTTERASAGFCAAHSSATIPPSDPPVTSATDAIPSSSTSRWISPRAAVRRSSWSTAAGGTSSSTGGWRATSTGAGRCSGSTSWESGEPIYLEPSKRWRSAIWPTCSPSSA